MKAACNLAARILLNITKGLLKLLKCIIELNFSS